MARAKSLLVLALAALAVAGGHAQVVTIGADGVVSVGATAQPVNVNGLAGTPVDGFSEARPIVSVPDTACTPVLMALSRLRLTSLVSMANKTGLLEELTAPYQTLLVPLESAFSRHFARNSTLYSRKELFAGAQFSELHGFVRYGIIPGAFPTRSLRNLQRLYGLLPGINVAVKVPPRGVKKSIEVLGVFGDTRARMTRKDIPVCGGGFIHILDDVVLPYKL